jgi:hypothetical protein
MKKLFVLVCVIFLGVSFACAEGALSPKAKFILMIAEQNIEGPQKCWWASEIDLSMTESVIAQSLLSQGYEILEPSFLEKAISKDPAFRLVGITEQSSVKLARLSEADYVIVGKAVASAGGNAPQSRMTSCFANITAKVIRSSDGKVVAYLDASGSSVHMDVITGGKEALKKAGDELSAKIIGALQKGGKQ